MNSYTRPRRIPRQPSKRESSSFQERHTQLRKLVQAIHDIHSSSDISTMIRCLIAAALDIVQAESGAAGIVKDDGVSIAEYFSKGSLHRFGVTFAPGHGMPGLFLSAPEPVISNHLETHPLHPPALACRIPVHNFAAVPVLSRENRLLAYLEVCNVCREVGFLETDLEVLLELAGATAMALETSEAYRELREKNQFIETLLEHAPIGFAVNSMVDGKKVFVNSKFEEIYGCPKGTLVSVESHFESVFRDPLYRERMRERIMSDISSGDPSRMKWEDVEIASSDGRKRFVTAMNIPLPEQNLMISTVQDVTGRKAVEDSLRMSETRFKQLSNLAPVGIFSVDLAGKSVFVNDKWRELTGLSTEDASDYGWLRSIHPEDRERVKQEVLLARAERRPYQLEQRFLTSEGKLTWVNLSAIPILGTGGELTGYVGVIHDITTQKEIERSLSEAQGLLAQANRFKSSIFSNLTHEIRTPLSGIFGLAELLGDELKGTPQAELLALMNQSAERLTKTLDAILLLGQIESHSLPVKLLNTDPARVVRQIATKYAPMAREKGLKLTLKANNNDVVILIDEALLDQVLINVMDNALKFTPQGSVHLNLESIELNGARVAQISVIDTGVGMPPEFHEAAFEPFRQVSEGHNRRFEGPGLGLALSKGLVELMNGSISLASKTGGGTTVTICFPVAKSPESDNAVSG